LEVEVEFVHRGAPGDRRRVSGDEIVGIEPGHFTLEEASIPYHRVTEISYGGEVVFSRPPPDPPRKEKSRAQRSKKPPMHRKGRR
jgi:uncharacterized protein (UPF0248 family)